MRMSVLRSESREGAGGGGPTGGGAPVGGGASSVPDVDVLVSRVVDGVATHRDWATLEAVALRQPGVWRDVALAQRHDRTLREVVARAGDVAAAVDIERVMARAGTSATTSASVGGAARGRRRVVLGGGGAWAWAGWLVAAAVGVAAFTPLTPEAWRPMGAMTSPGALALEPDARVVTDAEARGAAGGAAGGFDTPRGFVATGPVLAREGGGGRAGSEARVGSEARAGSEARVGSESRASSGWTQPGFASGRLGSGHVAAAGEGAGEPALASGWDGEFAAGDDAASAALREYLRVGADSGRVVGEMPRKVLMHAEPAADGRGYDVVYVRQIVERARVGGMYRFSQDEAGRVTPVRTTLTRSPM
jgi:hypothetical protein